MQRMKIQSLNLNRTRRYALAAGLLALTAAALPGTLPGQTLTVPPMIDRAFVESLVKRLETDETQMKGQQEKIKDLESKQAATSATMSSLPPMAPEETFPKLQFHGFGDISYQASTRAVNNTAMATGVNFQPSAGGPGSYNSFYLGELDLFVTSQLAEHWSAMVESVISASTANFWGIDMERLELQWKGNDYFNVDAGRFHTAMGYYNTAYHHGTWFQNAVGRPSFLEYEDSGGLVPVHTVGLSVHGAIPSGKLNLQYFVEAGNGRDYATNMNRNPVQNLVDNNHFKAVNFALVAKPEWFPGGQFGAGIYHDTVTPDGLARTDELIPNAHVVYHNAGWEFLLEGFLIRHKPVNDTEHYSPMFYAQVAHKCGLYTPYFRFTYIHASMSDQIYATVLNQGGLNYGPTLGLRYDISTFVAIKAQYDHLITSGQRDGNEITVQAAFTF